ncbi:MAG: light-regulated signal transduction histidine kinase (bacteriophytochrome) [Limisphaerales bacterium]
MPSQLNVEKTMLGLVFQNLVTNAIKFNRNTKPTVQIKAIESDNDWRFEIKDNGIGIEEGNEEKVFQIFQRLHRKDEYAGTGIGLAMCRKIVERHQGKIWYDSDSGGTTFKFTVSKKLQEKCKAPQTKYSKSF